MYGINTRVGRRKRARRGTISDSYERIEWMASDSAVMIFTLSTCIMCHAVKQLVIILGVSPTVHEIDKDSSRRQLEGALLRCLGKFSGATVPVVFVGGRLVGSSESVFASHLHGTLVQLLKDAGALGFTISDHP